MKNLLASTAVLMSLTGAAFADGHAKMSEVGTVSAEPTDFFASDLIGMRIYNVEVEFDASQPMMADGEKEWDDIGEINDIIVTADGQVSAVILGIGGFIGIGERDVSVPMSSIMVLTEAENDDRFLVVKTSKEMLEQAPAFERDDM
jgi:hypothetical protein